ncbi:MAG: hypothetical protein R2705_22815 [Ilumatobacteraceae bacterium]
MLEQYATPDELLAAPASPFVEAFLGRETALRRLGLLSIGELVAGSGPAPAPTMRLAVARLVVGRLVARRAITTFPSFRGRRPGALRWTCCFARRRDDLRPRRRRPFAVRHPGRSGTPCDEADAVEPDSFIWWGWIADHTDDVRTRTVEHVQLTVVALAVGFVISALLSLVILRHRRTYGPIAGFASMLYTIPSPALLGLLVPFTGLGFVTAEIALVSYTILVFVRNIVAGFGAVPPAARDAAEAMGSRRLNASGRSSCRWRCRASSPDSGSPRSRSWAWSRSRRSSATAATAPSSTMVCPVGSAPRSCSVPVSRSCSP